jgi:hypothetical protein
LNVDARRRCGVGESGAGYARRRRPRIRRKPMPKKSSGSSIKKPDTYEALKDKGMSKERAAKISNAQAKKKGGKS